MKKRGQLIFKAIYSLILSAVIVLFLPMVANQYGSGEAYEKLAVAKDIALMTDTLYSMPGDAEVFYPCDCENYIIVIENNEVKVLDPELVADDPVKGIYSFTAMGPYRLPKIEMRFPKLIKFEKKGNILQIKQEK